MKNKKYYISTVLIRNGDYETLTNYCFKADDEESAEQEVIAGFDIGNNDGEEVAELYKLVEVTEEEFAILSKYI